MNRNSELHFSEVPSIEIQRATFTMTQNIKTTFNAGEIIPFFGYPEVYPGDTFKISGTFVIRQSTPIYPTMDNAWADLYMFYSPDRIEWQHTAEFYGEAKDAAWVNTEEYVIPQLTTPEGGAAKGTIMDYFGIPTGIAGLKFSALPFRAYINIYNEWFRDQNLIAPLTHYTDDTDRTANNDDPTLGGKPCKAAKAFDYFTACMPAPQRGEAITLPIGSTAPVQVFGSGKGLALWDGSQQSYLVGTSQKDVIQVLPNDPFPNDTGVQFTNQSNVTLDDRILGINPSSNIDSGLKGIADLSQAVAATINAQRFAFQMQRLLEAMARGGARYREIIRNVFKTNIQDGRVQIPEYLGGKRIPITMQQVAQTSGTTETSPQGNMAAFSLTVDSDEIFTKSFTEWGCIIGLIVIRQEHSYNQGLNRMWTRRKRLDKYWPQFAHLGEQPVYNYEIFAQGNEKDQEVFGYQERYAELRYLPNIITGAFRTTYAQSLDAWHYGDDYDSLPVLSKEWIEETKQFIDRTLAVTSEVEDQFIMDCQLEIKATRPMPVYSVPGLIDHM